MIVGTANHYWVDAAVAAVLLGVALLLVPRPCANDPEAGATVGTDRDGRADGHTDGYADAGSDSGPYVSVPGLPRREGPAVGAGAGR